MSARIPARVLLSHPLGWIASGFGVGLAPKAAGTFGSIAAIVPWWFMRELQPIPYLLVLAATFALGVWAANWVIRRIGVEDPGAVVWDEFVGMWIALLPWRWPHDDWRPIVLGFVLFRLFDIWKPWPVRWADRSVHGGFGAMLDDAIAGVMAFVVLHAILLVLFHYFPAVFVVCSSGNSPWC